MRQFLNKIYKFWHWGILIGFSLIPILWFWNRPGQIVNGIDTNFPLDPIVWFTRRLYVWNPITNGGVDFSSSTAGFFFHLLQVIPYTFNLNLQLVQILNLIFWFGAIVVCSYLMSSLIIKSKLGQILFVCLYSFNIYLFNTWENVKVANLSLVAGLPLFLYILLSLRQKRISKLKASFLSIILGILVSGTGINPAYLFSLLLTVCLFIIGFILGGSDIKKALSIFKEFMLITIIVILVNLFWILPTAYFIFKNISPDLSIEKIGFTNWIDSLSENTSLLNIIRGQGAWDWYAFDSITGLPLYIPYALNYFFKIPFLIFSFLIPSLVILAFVFIGKHKSNFIVPFGIMFLFGVFLGAGTHFPTGSFYNFLYLHLPFFTLFRSPWYIFTPMVLLSIAGLIGLLIDFLADVTGKKRLLNLVVGVFALSLIIGNLIYSYPLVLGKIFRPEKEDSFFVKFPDYVFESKGWIENNLDGRIVNYPPDEIEKFEWGYRGIESILTLFTDKEVLFSPLNTPNSQIANLLKEFYSSLIKDEKESTYNLASKLNVGQIFYKSDQESLSLELPKSFLSLKSNTFGKWQFFDTPKEEQVGKFYIAEGVYVSHNTSPVSLTATSKKDVVIDSKDSVFLKVADLSGDSGSIVLAENNQIKDLRDFQGGHSRFSDRFKVRDLSIVKFEFDTPADALFQPMLERYKAEEFGIKLEGTQAVKIDGQEITLIVEKVTDSYIFYNPMRISQGRHTLVIDLINQNLIENGNFEGQFIHDSVGEGEVILEGESNRHIRLVNKSNKDFYLNFVIGKIDPLIPYMVSSKFRQIYGNLPQIIVNQANDRTLLKTQVETFPYFPEWKEASVFFEPVKTSSELNLELVAPHTPDQLGTTVVYDDLVVSKVFINNLLLVKKDDSMYNLYPEITVTKKSPTNYSLNVKNAENEHILVFSENYNPFWEVSMRSVNGEGIDIKPIHFSANLYANAWYIEESPNEYLLEISYRPQNLFVAGFAISAMTPLIIFALSKLVFILSKFRKRREPSKDVAVVQLPVEFGIFNEKRVRDD